MGIQFSREISLPVSWRNPGTATVLVPRGLSPRRGLFEGRAADGFLHCREDCVNGHG